VGPESVIGELLMGNFMCLTEQSSTGKSGSFFYYTADGKLMLKTISRDEFYFLH
jgi:1-phosphatidylinositol-4-phosphate 5-kinase